MFKVNKKLTILFFSFLFLVGCQTLKDGLEGNKKSKSAEEFLIEKKNPLVLPPDYSKLPVPKDETKEEVQNNEFDLKKVLKKTPNADTNSQSEVNKSLKKSVLDKIKSN